MAGNSTTSPPGRRNSDEGALSPGEHFAGHRIERVAGRGGMAVVYATFHLRLRVMRALKILTSEAGRDQVFRARFERESQLAASLEHPNIVPIYEAGESEGALYMSMRLVDGPNLSQVLEAGPLSLERAVDLVTQLAAALDAAHEHGLVHRDVKPANVLLEGAPGSQRIFLGDFGISRLVREAKALTETGEMIGTVNYVAPEQIAGEVVDPRSDVYSLACVAYEALTGAPPFERETQLATMFAHANDARPRPSSLRTELSDDVDRVLGRALAITSAERYTRASDFADELARAVAGQPVKARGRAGSRSRRRVAAIAAGIAAIAGVGALAIVGVFGGLGSSRPSNSDSASVPAPPARAEAAVEVARHPVAVAVGPFNVWAASPERKAISAIVPANSDRAQPPLAVDGAPVSLVAAFGSIWAVDRSGNSLLRLTPGQSAPPVRIPVGLRPSDVAVSSNALWVTNKGDNTVSRVDPDSNRVDTTAPAGDAPSSIAVGEGAVWIADSGDGDITALDPASARPSGAPLHVGGTPIAIAAGEAGVWVVDSSEGRILRVSPGSRQVSRPIIAGAEPTAVTTGFGYAWVAFADGEVRRIDPTRLAPAGDPIKVGRKPTGIAAGDGFVWTADRGDSTVTRIRPTQAG